MVCFTRVSWEDEFELFGGFIDLDELTEIESLVSRVSSTSVLETVEVTIDSIVCCLDTESSETVEQYRDATDDELESICDDDIITDCLDEGSMTIIHTDSVSFPGVSDVVNVVESNIFDEPVVADDTYIEY